MSRSPNDYPDPPADDSPEVQAWDRERQRLELAAACALRQLLTHMGPVAAVFIPYDGAVLEVRKVSVADAR